MSERKTRKANAIALHHSLKKSSGPKKNLSKRCILSVRMGKKTYLISSRNWGTILKPLKGSGIRMYLDLEDYPGKVQRSFKNKFITMKSEAAAAKKRTLQIEKEKADLKAGIPSSGNFSITSLWDTDEKIRTMTGISSIAQLNKLTEACLNLRKFDHLPPNLTMPMRDRILMATYKGLTSVPIEQVAILFQISVRQAKKYFLCTRRLLAGVVFNEKWQFKYWTSKA